VIRLRIDRTLPVPPERVWRALTDPVALAAWFWPAHFHTTAAVDARPGGRFRIDGPGGPGGGIGVTGEYAVVESPSRLVFTWRWDGEDGQTLVTIELSGVEGGTALTLTHERFASDPDRDNHYIGWSDCLARLPAFVTPRRRLGSST